LLHVFPHPPSLLLNGKYYAEQFMSFKTVLLPKGFSFVCHKNISQIIALRNLYRQKCSVYTVWTFFYCIFKFKIAVYSIESNKKNYTFKIEIPIVEILKAYYTALLRMAYHIPLPFIYNESAYQTSCWCRGTELTVATQLSVCPYLAKDNLKFFNTLLTELCGDILKSFSFVDTVCTYIRTCFVSKNIQQLNAKKLSKRT
jgi:hypothetical protein